MAEFGHGVRTMPSRRQEIRPVRPYGELPRCLASLRTRAEAVAKRKTLSKKPYAMLSSVVLTIPPGRGSPHAYERPVYPAAAVLAAAMVDGARQDPSCPDDADRDLHSRTSVQDENPPLLRR